MGPRYTPLSHEASDEESSPEDDLLTPSINSRTSNSPKTYSLTLNPTLVLHLTSLILGIPAFIIFVVAGGVPFIATDIFLAFILILDFFTVVHHTFSNVFQITVQLRHGSWKSECRSSETSKAARYIDLGLTLCLTVSLITGNALEYDPGIWVISAVFGYLIIIAHAALVIPSVNSFNLTISATRDRRRGKKRPDSRGSGRASGRPTGLDVGADIVSARGRSVEVDDPREPVQDLV